MSDSNNVFTGGGISLGGLLFVVFVALKLGVGQTAVMTWSWWWVACPLWIPFCATIGIMCVIGAIAVMVGIFALLFNKFFK